MKLLVQLQLDEVQQLNARILRVAQDACIPVLDVFALDSLVGSYLHADVEDFHSPSLAYQHAALAALLMLRVQFAS